MTRKKVKLAFITNDSARKATFKKRKKGLIKKVSELSTLCGIEACAIIYSPYDSQPEIWPSPLGVRRVVAQFKEMPEMEQSKKMVNQESFLRQRIVKAKEQLKKQQKDNREKEVSQVMFHNLSGRAGLHNLNIVDLNDLGRHNTTLAEGFGRGSSVMQCQYFFKFRTKKGLKLFIKTLPWSCLSVLDATDNEPWGPHRSALAATTIL
ncbi:hypothetical protein L1049_020137 [Liquidambar formosana]|uniref:MADS-box domain-containing protein n=1 Tax=Liquidambar formosana TaxID=63359 RepID=A0AAP0X761_LIQFO